MDVIETDRADVQVNSDGATRYVNNYKIMDMLGEGTFSKVYLCQNDAGNEFALKIINKSILKRKREYKRVDGKLVLSNAFQKVQKEVAIMKKFVHSNLVRLFEVIDSPADDKLFLVLELIRGGQVMYWDDKQLRYFSRNTPTGVLSKNTVRECLRDVVAALDYLHHNHICHRDVKPENILLSSDRYKLADFGVAYMDEDEPSAATAATLKLRSTEGTYYFLAPECTTGEEYDPYQVDVWALGVTMYTLLVGTLPFGTNILLSVTSLSDVMISIREDPLILPPELDPECAELLSRLMEKDPKLRITIPQLKAHPWISGSVGELDRVSSDPAVMVTQQEIEDAITPVNNFILVMKLKLKMSSRLNIARKALATNYNRAETVPVTKYVPVPSTEDEGSVAFISKAVEMAPGEQPEERSNRLQRRSSRIVETINATVGSLTTTLTRRKSHYGAASPVFDDPAPAVSSPVPEESSPGKKDAKTRPRAVLRSMSTLAVRSLISDIQQHSDNAKATEGSQGEENRDNLSAAKSDTDPVPLESSRNSLGDKTLSKRESGIPPNLQRLTKRKSTMSYRSVMRAIEIPEEESPIYRKKRRESFSGEGDDGSVQRAMGTAIAEYSVNKDICPRQTDRGNSAPPRRLLRQKSMPFRDLVTTPVLATADSDTGCNELSLVKTDIASGASGTPATTRPSRRLMRRKSSREMRSLHTLIDTPQREELELPFVIHRFNSKVNGALVSTPDESVSIREGDRGPPTDNGEGENDSTVKIDCNSPSKTEIVPGSLSRSPSRRSSSHVIPPTAIDEPKDLASEASFSDLPRNATDITTANSVTDSDAPSTTTTATSPQIRASKNATGSLEVKDNVQQPKLPSLELSLSSAPSPATSPTASPRNIANSSDKEAVSDSKHRPTSPSKAIEAARLASLRGSPTPRRRSSSLNHDEFSSSSDEEGSFRTNSFPKNSPSQGSFPHPERSSTNSSSPRSRRKTLLSTPRGLHYNRLIDLVEEEDPNSALTRKSSLAKVLDQCITTEEAVDRIVKEAAATTMAPTPDASPLPETETLVTPMTPRRSQAQVPPLVRPEDQSGEQLNSNGRRHQISPRGSIANPSLMESPTEVVKGGSESPTSTLEKPHPRRSSLVKTQNPVRVLLRGKHSLRLSVLDGQREVRHVNPDKLDDTASKVCGIM